MAKVEHYLVSTIYRLRGEKRETISFKSHVALSRGVRYQLQSNRDTDTEETIESVYMY